MLLSVYHMICVYKQTECILLANTLFAQHLNYGRWLRDEAGKKNNNKYTKTNCS